MYMVSQPLNLEILAFKKLVQWAKFEAQLWIHKLRPQHFDKQNQHAKSKEPASLESMSQESLSLEPVKQELVRLEPEELTEQEEQLVARQMKLFQNHICILNSDYHNKLLQEIIFRLILEERGEREKKWWQQVITFLIKSFFTSKLTVLKVAGMMSMLHLVPPPCSLTQLPTRLTHLELQLSVFTFSCKNGHSVEEEIIQILKPLQVLKYLVVENLCTENVLKCVVEHCPLIEELKISQSRKQIPQIDDRIVHLLIQLRCLRRLYLIDTSVGPNGVEELIIYCENLEYIDVCGLLDKDHALGCSDTMKEKPAGRVSNLKTFSTAASLKQLENLVQICPNIQYMSISDCNRDDECNLKALPRLKDISQLKLIEYDFYNDRLTETLRDIGRSLTDLHLDEICKIDLDALKDISQTCPNLQSLSLASCKFLVRPSRYGQLEIAPFRKLKRLYYAILRERHEIPLLEFLLCNSLTVEYIDILSSNMDLLSEDFMLSVLDNNPFRSLKKLVVTKKLFRSRASSRVTTVAPVPDTSTRQLVLDRLLQSGCRPEVIQRSAGWCLPLREYHRPPAFPRN